MHVEWYLSAENKQQNHNGNDSQNIDRSFVINDFEIFLKLKNNVRMHVVRFTFRLVSVRTSLHSYEGVLSDDSISSVNGSGRGGLFAGVADVAASVNNVVSFGRSSRRLTCESTVASAPNKCFAKHSYSVGNVSRAHAVLESSDRPATTILCVTIEISVGIVNIRIRVASAQ